MKKKIASLAVAAAALGGTVAMVPAVASAQDDPPAEESVERETPEWVSEALQPMIDDGTLTEAEADRVIDSLREARPEGRFHHRGFKSAETLTEVLGIEQEALREPLVDGQSIADIAAAQGVDVQTVIDALVADANARLDEAVTEGRIDAADADEKRAELEEMITARVNGERPEGARFGPSADAEEEGA